MNTPQAKTGVEVERFEPERYDEDRVRMELHSDGDYMRYSDHVALLAAKQEEVDKMREACLAGEQCIADFIELYRRGASLIAMDEAVKSLKNDALKSIRAALHQGEPK